MIASAPPLWTRDDAARATGGRAHGAAWQARGVSIDSRTLAPGDLFVALAGPNFDGHTFVADALARGAAAALVSRLPVDVAQDAPLLMVDDTLEGLRCLARAARARSVARVVAVTGSVGKTGVKEALALVLGGQGETHASAGSFNNHWGVPLSLARLPADAPWAVFEIGMNHPGEITPLVHLVCPHVAAITTVEAVHIENFPSVQAIADAKAEIFTGMQPGGTAVLNRDSPHFDRLAARAADAGVGRVVTFGRSTGADARVLAADDDEGGSTVTAELHGAPMTFRVDIAGSHWVTNALCVLAIVDALGADARVAASAVAGLRPPKGRGLRSIVRLSGGSFELIDDSYNASPVSMAAAFQVLGRSRPGLSGRRIAVLGDMLELGRESPTLHFGLARTLLANGVDLVFTAGPMMAHLRAALPAALRAEHAANSALLAPVVAAAVRRGDVVTVKGSAGSRMRHVVEALLALDEGVGGETTSASRTGK